VDGESSQYDFPLISSFYPSYRSCGRISSPSSSFLSSFLASRSRLRSAPFSPSQGTLRDRASPLLPSSAGFLSNRSGEDQNFLLIPRVARRNRRFVLSPLFPCVRTALFLEERPSSLRAEGRCFSSSLHVAHKQTETRPDPFPFPLSPSFRREKNGAPPFS